MLRINAPVMVSVSYGIIQLAVSVFMIVYDNLIKWGLVTTVFSNNHIYVIQYQDYPLQ